MKLIKKIQAALRLNEAIRQADKAHRQTGKRYYVMPAPHKQLIIMDRFNFRKMKQKNYITDKANIALLEKECFYCTPYRNGQGTLPPECVRQKKKQYLRWFAEPVQ